MQYINEAKRWQKLAGIITEETAPAVDAVADKDAETALKQALSVLQSGEDSVQVSPQDGELDEFFYYDEEDNSVPGDYEGDEDEEEERQHQEGIIEEDLVDEFNLQGDDDEYGMDDDGAYNPRETSERDDD
jgi:hypothetical protein